MGATWYIETSSCTGKDLSSAVWIGCKIIPDICQSRDSIEEI